MTSDSDNDPHKKDPVDDDGLDDFDDFDDFDEAGDLDAFEVSEDPFANEDEAEFDEEIDISAELDAFAAADDDHTNDAATMAEAATGSQEDEFESDDFSPAPTPMATAEQPDSDQDIEDDFDPFDDHQPTSTAGGQPETNDDEFETDDFEPEEVMASAPPLDDEEEDEDFATGDFSATAADHDDSAEAEAEPTSEPVEESADDMSETPDQADDFDADDDLDAMLQAHDQSAPPAPAMTTATTAELEPEPAEPAQATEDTDLDMGDDQEDDGFDLGDEPELPVAADTAEPMPEPAELIETAEDDAEFEETADFETPAEDQPATAPAAAQALPNPDPGDDDDSEWADDGVEATTMGTAAGVATAVDDGLDDLPAAPQKSGRGKDGSKKRSRPKGPSIPLIDIGENGFDKVAEAYPKRLRAVQDLATRKLTRHGIQYADKICRKWAGKATMPYRLELDAVDTALADMPGAYVINLAFEMGCTTGAVDDPEGGRRLLHTLDWNIDGLGRLVVIARRHAKPGMWVNFTWPGYIGCLQGLAPGRFAAVINHAPSTGKGPPMLSWPMSKMRWYGQKGTPPAFLLRRVFDECEDFDSAVEMIEKTPICYPAIFSVLGLEDGEFSIIERTENAKSTQKRAPAVTNHWLNSEFGGTTHAYQSQERLVAMKSRVTKGVDADEWLVHPIINPDTRLAVDLNPATGRMRVRGYQGLQPATTLLDAYAD